MHTENAYCEMHTVKCILWSAYYEMHTLTCIMWYEYSKLHTLNCILWNAYCEMHMGQKDQDGYYVEKCQIFSTFELKYAN